MKLNIIALATFMLSPLFLMAQLQPTGSLPFTPPQLTIGNQHQTNGGSQRATTCDQDTVIYFQSKATGLQAIGEGQGIHGSPSNDLYCHKPFLERHPSNC